MSVAPGCWNARSSSGVSASEAPAPAAMPRKLRRLTVRFSQWWLSAGGAEPLRSERQVLHDRSEVYGQVMAIPTCAGRIGESMVSPAYDQHVNFIAPSPDPRYETGFRSNVAPDGRWVG